jgi:hypothetical protein
LRGERRLLGESFDEKTKESWIVAYQTLSGVMIEGAAYGTDTPAPATKEPWFKRILGRATA